MLHNGEGGRLWLLMALVAVVTTAVALTALDSRATYGAQTTADEPQYLTTALSLAEDFDLDISDELENDAFIPFHEIGLNPQTIDLTEDGQRISPHDPLLPLITAPAMGLGGWQAVKVQLAVMGGITAAATLWLAVRRFGVSPGVAAWVVGGLHASPPLVSYANQVYPELPAALTVVLGVAALTAPNPTRRHRLIAVVAIVALPWLAVKYVPVASVLAAGLFLPLVRTSNRRPVVSPTVWPYAALLAVSGVVYLVVHQRIYGGWTVYASGDHFVDGEWQVVGRNPDYVGRTLRLIGLLIDRGFGLIPWAPAYLAFAPAVAHVAMRRPTGWRLPMAVLAAGWATATWVALTMHGWWWPGRQVVVVLPIATVFIALLVDSHRRLLRPFIVASALGIMSWVWLAYETSTDRRTLVVDFGATANPWYRAWSRLFPDHRLMDNVQLVPTVIWGVILGFAALVAAREAQRHRREAQRDADQPASNDTDDGPDESAPMSSTSGNAAP
ncbi:MAG: hypothetical protein AAF467_17740 [Actinomycetota bacterium]